jgi:hypothetical protein
MVPSCCEKRAIPNADKATAAADTMDPRSTFANRIQKEVGATAKSQSPVVETTNKTHSNGVNDDSAWLAPGSPKMICVTEHSAIKLTSCARSDRQTRCSVALAISTA